MADPIPPTKIEDFIQNLPVEVPEDGVKLFGLNPGSDLRSFQVHFVTSGISVDPNKFGHQLILGIKGADGSPGGQGIPGNQGLQGEPGASSGVPLHWDVGTADANPGLGNVRANHTNLLLATVVYVSKQAASGVDIANFLAALDDSNNPTSKGVLYLTRETDKVLTAFEVTGITDAAGYVKVAVSNPSGATGFTDNDDMSFFFARTGQQGQIGNTGLTGAVGTDAGIGYWWSTTTTDANPGSGFIRANNANITSATFLYASKNNRANSPMDTFLAQLVGSTSPIKGIITLTRKSDMAQATLQLTTYTNATGYVKLGVSGGAGTTSFSSNDELTFGFARAGDVGSTPALIASGVSFTPVGGLASTTVQTALQELDSEKIPTSYLDTDVSLSTNSDLRLATQKATKAYVDTQISTLLASQDAMVFRGVVDASTNPNYPAADRGDTYRVGVAGKIGGGSGPNVEAGDILIATADGVSSGNHATVGTSWSIIQTNLDGAMVTGSYPNLLAIEALSPADDDFIQRKAGAWTKRTPSQVKADLALVATDVGFTAAGWVTGANTQLALAKIAANVQVAGADAASNTTLVLGDGSEFTVTGTTDITAVTYTTHWDGREATLVFAGATNLVYNASTLLTPGSVNMAVSIGDVVNIVKTTSGLTRITNVFRRNGLDIAVDIKTGTLADARLPARLQAGSSVSTVLNNITDSGFYRYADTATNAPEAVNGLLLHTTYDANNMVQEAQTYNSDNYWRRRKVSGTWGSWYRIYGSASELTVAADIWANTSGKLVSTTGAWLSAVPVNLGGSLSGSLSLNFGTFINAYGTLSANITFNAVSNLKQGQSGVITLTNPSGAYTLSINTTVGKTNSGAAMALGSGENKVSYYCDIDSKVFYSVAGRAIA